MDSYRLVPAANPGAGPSKVASVANTAGSLGLHDTLRYGPSHIGTSLHTLDGGIRERLEAFDETQDALRLKLQRDVYGMHAPLRTLMERKLVGQDMRIPALAHAQGLAARGNVHLDILMGRDELIEPHDVFFGQEIPGDSKLEGDIHREMEAKLKI
jgi:proteasome maturation protein